MSFDTKTKTLTIFLETLITFIYASTELGYISIWVLSDKPYELYSVLNMGKWDGKLSRFQTDDTNMCGGGGEPSNKLRIPRSGSSANYQFYSSGGCDDIYANNNQFMNQDNNNNGSSDLHDSFSMI